MKVTIKPILDFTEKEKEVINKFYKIAEDFHLNSCIEERNNCRTCIFNNICPSTRHDSWEENTEKHYTIDSDLLSNYMNNI